MTRLCVFARAPVRGTVKRRLARSLGEAGALAAYVRLVEHALAQLARTPGVTSELWVAGPPAHPGVLAWSERFGVPVREQRGGDLGARMRHSIDACLADGEAGIVVGTDCPAIDAPYVTRAAALLERSDLVLGPAEDGGYGLVGLRCAAPELFAEMPWGTAAVTGETLARARAAGRSHVCLPTIWDVDDEAGWRRFLALQADPTG